MSKTRQFLDKLHPHFHKGGRYEVLYPVYEMVDTFLYSPADVTVGATHVRDAIAVSYTHLTLPTNREV